MADTLQAVQVSLRRLLGSDHLLGTAYAGWFVQFGAASWGPTPHWRVVWFRGDQAMTRGVDVPWHELEPLYPDLLEFCARALDVRARFDTSDSWEAIEIAVSLNGRDTQRLSLSLRSSGFTGTDAALLTRILDTIEARAGITHLHPPTW